ncbi:type IV pilin protein [Geothrix sp. 21YS21S-4]|uniref:type IV pilin protein n=1 Tax=Geothrix sp. 21YS21S-4 TaxID=3068889 RepID=UPI0027B95D10|nr:prepilin-type N-terminal cleavage/methylation domain-containing protein [Geothrix sp. 21YS21S-4]
MFRPSNDRPRSQGFSLIELLLVVFLIGVISAIAIPSYLGQRKRARVIGDAIANAQTLRMGLETRRAENGLYGVAGQVYTWKADGTDASGPTLIPTFQPKGASRMNYEVKVDANGVAYVLTVTDPTMGNATAYQTNQAGEILAKMK